MRRFPSFSSRSREAALRGKSKDLRANCRSRTFNFESQRAPPVVNEWIFFFFLRLSQTFFYNVPDVTGGVCSASALLCHFEVPKVQPAPPTL